MLRPPRRGGLKLFYFVQPGQDRLRLRDQGGGSLHNGLHILPGGQ